MTTGLPSGMVTFMFTDIEASTRLLRALGRAYARVLVEHHEILDRVVRNHGGIRMSDEGDGGFFVFESATAAVLASIDAQQELAAHRWETESRPRVRMGIHTGESDPSPDGRYVGLDVHLAARIADSGHGDQILLSERTAALVANALAHLDLCDLGVHDIDDFPEPSRILQVGSQPFPPLRARTHTTIPRPIGSFVGRADETTRLPILIDRHRLVTILGPGGTGKTRLALEVGMHMRGAGRQCHFVDLTSIRTADLVGAGVATALGIADHPESDPLRRAAGILGRNGAVLILDNCEHLSPHVGRYAAALLAMDERTRVLATSRSPLGIPGERRFELGPLPTVGADHDQGPAVRLFLDRAADVMEHLRIDEATLAAATDICTRLDGLPLAIELAASMTRLLPPHRLAEALAQRIDFLEGGSGLPDRHRTLVATIDWSVSSLGPQESEMFRRLGVMAGPFGLDDAAAVAQVDPFTALGQIGSLRDRSLIRDSGGSHYGMLETIRWYARNDLESSGRSDHARLLHMERFRSVAVDARHRARSEEGIATLDHLWTIRANLARAIDHALDIGRVEAAVDIVEGMVDVWAVRAGGREALLTTDRVAAAAAGGPATLECRALVAGIEVRQASGIGKPPNPRPVDRVAFLAATTGDDAIGRRALVWRAAAGHATAEEAEAALTALEAGSDHRAAASAMEAVGWMLWWHARFTDAGAVFRRLYRRGREGRDLLATLDGAAGIIAAARSEPELEEARVIGDEMDELARRAGAHWWEAMRLQWMAGPANGHEDAYEASEWLSRAHRVAVERGTNDQIAFITADQATNAWQRGDVLGTYAKIVEFAETFMTAGESPANPFVAEMAAAVAVAWRLDEEAARLVGAAEAWRAPGGLTDRGMPMPEWDRERHEATLSRLRGRIRADAYEALRRQGAVATTDEVINMVMNLRPPLD